MIIEAPVALWAVLLAVVLAPIIVGMLTYTVTQNDDVTQLASLAMITMCFVALFNGPTLKINAKAVDRVVIVPDNLGATAQLTMHKSGDKLEIVADGETTPVNDRFDQLSVKTTNGKPIKKRTLKNVPVEELQIVTYETNNIFVAQTIVVAEVTISDNHTDTVSKLFGD